MAIVAIVESKQKSRCHIAQYKVYEPITVVRCYRILWSPFAEQRVDWRLETLWSTFPDAFVVVSEFHLVNTPGIFEMGELFGDFGANRKNIAVFSHAMTRDRYIRQLSLDDRVKTLILLKFLNAWKIIYRFVMSTGTLMRGTLLPVHIVVVKVLWHFARSKH